MNTKEPLTNSKKENKEDNQKSDSPIVKAILIILLYLFFILSGIQEEKQYKTKYPSPNSPSSFVQLKHPTISIFMVSIVTSIISVIGYYLNKKQVKHPEEAPFHSMDRPLLGLYYILSKYSSEYSIQYVDYIIKVIGKSCKSASIMMISMLYHVPIIGAIFKKLINQKTTNAKASYTKKDIIKVIFTTASVLLFSYNPKAVVSSKSSSSVIGYSLLIFSVVCDGLLCLKEKIIIGEVQSNPKYEGYEKVLSWEYMMIYAFCSLIFCFGGIIYGLIFNNLYADIVIYFSCIPLMKDILFFATVNALGQVVLFISLGKYGPLALSMITSVRKVLTIAFSIIIFGKTILPHQYISLILASAVIFMEVLDKQKNSKKKTN